eukprot:scaffold67444_cov24-Cyclotella_meneghiniana.AAC.2
MRGSTSDVGWSVCSDPVNEVDFDLSPNPESTGGLLKHTYLPFKRLLLYCLRRVFKHPAQCSSKSKRSSHCSGEFPWHRNGQGGEKLCFSGGGKYLYQPVCWVNDNKMQFVIEPRQF